MTHGQRGSVGVAAPVPCRLCGGPSRRQFAKVLLGKYDVTYYRCDRCGSLQTEVPYWLDDAYRAGNLAESDPGPFVRSVRGATVVFISARLLRLPTRARVLDFGGGVGLLCRMLRDIGFDAYVSDRYAMNQLARGFDDTGAAPDMICAFEVVEHFSDPSKGMAEILARGARVCVVGTYTYEGQGADWWYLGALSGQHVFFYSEVGMRLLAAGHGYHYKRIGDLHFFFRDSLGWLRADLLRRALSERHARCVWAYLALKMSNRFAESDMRAAVRRLGAAGPGKAAGH